MFDIPKRLIDTSNTTRQSANRTVSPRQDFEIGGSQNGQSTTTLFCINYMRR
jgi:hypothetical protein